MAQEKEVVKSEAETATAKVVETKVETAKVEVGSEKVETVKTEETKVPAIKTDASINIEKAKAIFEAMPHITTIWFDKKGGWRFYPTPDSNPIHKEKS